MDSEGRVRDWNPSAEQVFGFTRDEAIGREVAELIIPGPMRDAHRNGLRRYLETGEPTILDRRVDVSGMRRDGTEFPLELAVTRLPDSDPPLFAAFMRPLREHGPTERENARLQQRMTFLAQAGLVLDSSLEFGETLHRLAELTVPELAQLAVIDMIDHGRTIHTTVAAAPDPAHAHALERMRREHPLSLDGPHPVARVLRSGTPALLASMSAGFQREIAQGPEHYRLMRELGYHSAIVVPLAARQRVLGALSLLRMHDAEPYDEDDLVLTEELARRAALAVDNSRMFEATRDLARTLQDSLLPRELPEIPGVRITGRYRAAAQGQEVGGDFYDVFTIGSGYWGIAIGDVCGKGPEAAALTALARYTLRALAGRDPGTVLALLNENVMRDPALLPERFVTVLFAVASRSGDRLVLQIATAGHPAPLILRSDGAVERVRALGPLVGLAPGTEYRSTQVVLDAGDSLVLYTDGLTDARAPSQPLTDDTLVELMAGFRGLDGERLAELLESAATGADDPRDDIAIMVIEVMPGG